MKTKDEVLYAVEDFTEFLSYDKDSDRKRFLNILSKFEKEIRADQAKTRIKELTSVGEYKTAGEAREYCRLHGLDMFSRDANVFQIAGALMDARKDQERITTEFSAKIIDTIDDYEIEGCSNTGVIDRDLARIAILNTNTTRGDQ